MVGGTIRNGFWIILEETRLSLPYDDGHRRLENLRLGGGDVVIDIAALANGRGSVVMYLHNGRPQLGYTKQTIPFDAIDYERWPK